MKRRSIRVMTVEKTIAVIGATGAQGGSVARSLLQNPRFHVRCITRDSLTPKAKELKSLGTTVIQADTTSSQALEQALAGAWGLYINYTVFELSSEASENLGKIILSSAAAVGIKHVIFSSDPDPELLTGGQVVLSAMGVKAKAEAWARKNLHFETFTPIQAGWYLENFQSTELAEFHGGFPTKKDTEGYHTCRFPYWGGHEEVPWISVRDDYGDLVHGVFMNPLRWNLRVIQAVADPMSFVTGQAARFIPYASPAELGGDLAEGPASMFVYTQMRDGEYFSNGITETRTATQLKMAAYQAKGQKGRETLMTVGEWFKREFSSDQPLTQSIMTVTSADSLPNTIRSEGPASLPEVNLQAKSNQQDLIGEVIKGIERTGVCILRNMYSQDIVDAVTAELTPYIAGTGDYWGKTDGTAFLTALLTKSYTYATQVLAHKIYHKVNRHFLTTKFGPCPVTTGYSVTYDCEPQLDCTNAFYIPPGGPAQLLHRDDADHLNFQPAAPCYQQGRDTGIVFMTALTRTTAANGATRVLPGSHLWDYAQPFPEQNDRRIVDAELSPGDSLFMLTSVIHGGGTNTTATGRFVTACFTTRAHCRQLENQFLAYEDEDVKKLPLWLLRFMGYSTAKPFCGWVNKKDPLRVIIGEEEEKKKVGEKEKVEFLDGWPEPDM
ncbi:Uncharacterized protein F1880_009659 [Penicillium rolfsii]|nr:Uncharacterized protein F1880_009659 [Penicillium rolfsii]